MPRCTCIASDSLMCILLNALLSLCAVYALSKLYDISGDVSRIARFVHGWNFAHHISIHNTQNQGDKLLSRMSSWLTCVCPHQTSAVCSWFWCYCCWVATHAEFHKLVPQIAIQGSNHAVADTIIMTSF